MICCGQWGPRHAEGHRATDLRNPWGGGWLGSQLIHLLVSGQVFFSSFPPYSTGLCPWQVVGAFFIQIGPSEHVKHAFV